MAAEVVVEALRRLVPHARAAAVLLAGAVALLGSVPMPGPSSRGTLTHPDTRQELADWVGLLANVGLRTDIDALGEQVFAVGQAARTARRWTVGWFDPVIRLTGTNQGWGLFAYPRTRPFRLEIVVRRGRGPFEPVYVALDPERDWRAGWLQFRRVRALVAPARRPPSTYEPVVTAVAERLFAEDPTIAEVRVHFVQLRVAPPPGPIRVEERTRFAATRRRGNP
jgi:hypothetical protein